MAYVVELDGGRPWGVRLHAATLSDTDRPSDNCLQSYQQQQQQQPQQHVTVAKVCPNSKASESDIAVGDLVLAVNGVSTVGLTDTQLSQLLNSAQHRLTLQLASAPAPAPARSYSDNTPDGSTLQQQRPGGAATYGKKAVKQVTFNLPSTTSSSSSTTSSSNISTVAVTDKTGSTASSAARQGPSMSYLAPPSHHSRTHTRDKVLTPFRHRASSRDQTTAGTIQTEVITATDCDDVQRQTSNSSSQLATDSHSVARPQTERVTSEAATTSSDNYDVQMTSPASQRTQSIPVIVENYETNVSGVSMTSPVNTGLQSRPWTASSSSSAAAAAAASAGRRPATAPKPATKMSTGEPASHHVTDSYHPSSVVMTSDHAQLTSSQPLNHTSPPASPYVNISSPSVRQFRPFSPATGRTEPPVAASSRPWSPRTTQHSGQFVSESSVGLSSVNFAPHSDQSTAAQRPLSPPVSPTVSSGVVRVPYVPTAGMTRSGSVGANVRVLPRSPANHIQLATSSSSSSSSAAAAAAAAVAAAASVSSSVNDQVDSVVLTTPVDAQPSSPTNRLISNKSTSPAPGYRRVTAPNPSSVNTHSVNDYQSPGIAQNQNRSFGTSLTMPVSSVATDRSSVTEKAVLDSFDVQKVSEPGGHVTRSEQTSEMSQVNVNMRSFSPNSVIHGPVEATMNVSQKPNVPSFYQTHLPNYQQSEMSTTVGTSQARPFSPQTGQVPSVSYQSHPVNHQQLESSTTSGPPQIGPLSPKASQIPTMNYQQSEMSTTAGTSQARPFSPQTGQVPSVSYQSHPVNYQQSEMSTTAGTSQARPFSHQTGQLPPVSYQSCPVNYQQLESSTTSGSPQIGPLSPKASQVPTMNYQQSGISTMAGTSQTQPFSPQTAQVLPTNYRFHPTNYQQRETSTVSGPSQTRPFSPQTSQIPTVNYQQSETSTMSSASQARPFSPQTSQVTSMSYQSYPTNYQQLESSTTSSPPQIGPFSPKNSQKPTMNYPQSERFTMSGPPQTRPFSPQTSQTPYANYQQSEISSTSGASQARPFSPQTSQVPSMNYQSHPMNYQQLESSTIFGPPQIRPFGPHTFQTLTMNYQQSGMSGTSQARPFSPQTSQVPSVSYQSHPMNYQQYESSTVSGPPQARPFSPQITQIPATNYQQSHTSTTSGASQAQPFSSQTRQVPSTNFQSPSVNQHQFGISPGTPQARHSSPHVGVKQHVQRFSAPSSTQVNNSHQRQQQHAARPRAPAVTSHAGYDVNARRTEDAVITQGRPFSPRDVSWVQSPTDSSIASQDDGRTRIPDTPADSSSLHESNVSVAQSLEQRSFSPSAALVTWPVTSPTHTEQHHSAASVPASWSDDTDDRRRPFSAQAAAATTIARDGRQTSGEVTTEAGNDRRVLAQKRPFSPQSSRLIASTQGSTRPTENTSVVGQTDFHGEPDAATRNQTVYPNDNLTADVSTGRRIDNRPFSPSSSQIAGQPVHHSFTSPTVANVASRQLSLPADQSRGQPVSSPTVAAVDSYMSQQMDSRPFSPSSSQIAGQPVHHSFTSPTVANVASRPLSPPADQSRGQPVSSPTVAAVDSQQMDSRPFSPSSTTSVNEFAADQALSPTARPFSPLVSSSSLQRPSSAPSRSGGTEGNIQGYRRICFSPIPQSVRPAHRASPLPMMMSTQPATPAVSPLPMMMSTTPAAVTKDSRISVSGARLVFAPRRGSDVTASSPSHLTSSTARPQLKVLRENQVADWRDSRQPVMWTPPAAAAGRSQSLEPVSGLYVDDLRERDVLSSTSTVLRLFGDGKSLDSIVSPTRDVATPTSTSHVSSDDVTQPSSVVMATSRDSTQHSLTTSDVTTPLWPSTEGKQPVARRMTSSANMADTRRNISTVNGYNGATVMKDAAAGGDDKIVNSTPSSSSSSSSSSMSTSAASHAPAVVAAAVAAAAAGRDVTRHQLTSSSADKSRLANGVQNVSSVYKKDWYKQMYNALHRPSHVDQHNDEKSSSTASSSQSKTQSSFPGRIEDYEPGQTRIMRSPAVTSSAATLRSWSRDKRVVHAESDTEVEYSRRLNVKSMSPSARSEVTQGRSVYGPRTLQRLPYTAAGGGGRGDDDDVDRHVYHRRQTSLPHSTSAGVTKRDDDDALTSGDYSRQRGYNTLDYRRHLPNIDLDISNGFSKTLPHQSRQRHEPQRRLPDTSDESRDYTEWSRDDWLRLINSASDHLTDSVDEKRSTSATASSVISNTSDSCSSQVSDRAAEDSLVRPDNVRRTAVYGKAQAAHSFHADQSNSRELSFRRGDVLHLMRRIDKNWFEARLHGRVGIVPANYIQVMTSVEDAQTLATSRHGQARAKYNFSGQTALELSFRKGDMLTLIRQVDNNWYEGRSVDGGPSGILPISYVDTLVEPQSVVSTPMSSLAPSPLPGSSGQVSPVSTISGPMRPSPIQFDDVDVPDVTDDLTAAIQSTYGRHVTSRHDPSPQGHAKVTSIEQGHSRSVLEELSDRLQQGRKSRDAVTSQENDVMKLRVFGVDDGHHDNSVRSIANYPLYRAMYDYRPRNDDEMSLREGDKVEVMERCDDGWFVGLNRRTREFGTFPGNYVDKV